MSTEVSLLRCQLPSPSSIIPFLYRSNRVLSDHVRSACFPPSPSAVGHRELLKRSDDGTRVRRAPSCAPWRGSPSCAVRPSSFLLCPCFLAPAALAFPPHSFRAQGPAYVPFPPPGTPTSPLALGLTIPPPGSLPVLPKQVRLPSRSPHNAQTLPLLHV